MKKQIINAVFVLVFFVFLLLSLLKTVFYPEDINTYENRKAQKLEKISLSAFLDGDMQENVEASVTDQAFFAQKMKKTYNTALSKYMHTLTAAVSEASYGKYINLGSYCLYDRDKLLFAPYSFDTIEDAIRKRCEYFNNLTLKYPDTDFYFYYIEKDADIDFTTNEKMKVFDYMNENTNLPKGSKGVFRINNFEEYKDLFYKTDHHWNAAGSYKGYRELLEMLLPDETAFKEPIEAVEVSTDFRGSKTQTEKTALFSESFWAYRFSYEPMRITVNGSDGTYGHEEDFFDGKNPSELTYGEFYGGDEGEVIFDTGKTERENLLVIGESHDNAVLKLLAGHFQKTVSVDMRYYRAYMGRDFSLKQCMEENDIRKVLFIGSVGFYKDSTFEVE